MPIDVHLASQPPRHGRSNPQARSMTGMAVSHLKTLRECLSQSGVRVPSSQGSDRSRVRARGTALGTVQSTGNSSKLAARQGRRTHAVVELENQAWATIVFSSFFGVACSQETASRERHRRKSCSCARAQRKNGTPTV